MTNCASCGNAIDFHGDAQLYVCLKRLSKSLARPVRAIK